MFLNPFVSHEKEKSITFFMGLQSINLILFFLINFNYGFFSPIKGNLTEVSYYKMADKGIKI